jgi:hypothetical protein
MLVWERVMPEVQNRSMKCSRGDGRARFSYCCVGKAILGQAHHAAQDRKQLANANCQLMPIADCQLLRIGNR